jgi:hypothetical protein
MSETLGTPGATCKGLLYNFTRRPPVYGHFCAVSYRRVPGICGNGTAYGTGKLKYGRPRIRYGPQPYLQRVQVDGA